MSDNKVVSVSSSMVEFMEKIPNFIENHRSKKYYQNHFKNNSILYYKNPITGQEVTVQKIVNTYRNKKM